MKELEYDTIAIEDDIETLTYFTNKLHSAAKIPAKFLSAGIYNNIHFIYECPNCKQFIADHCTVSVNDLTKTYFKLTSCECKNCNTKLDLFTNEDNTRLIAHYSE